MKDYLHIAYREVWSKSDKDAKKGSKRIARRKAKEALKKELYK